MSAVWPPYPAWPGADGGPVPDLRSAAWRSRYEIHGARAPVHARAVRQAQMVLLSSRLLPHPALLRVAPPTFEPSTSGSALRSYVAVIRGTLQFQTSLGAQHPAGSHRR